jgi:hypothetical protein
MVGVVELSDSIIESPQGLHSNAYKFSARARLIDPEGHRSAADGARSFVTGYEIFAHCSIMHSVPGCNLDADQRIGKRRRATSPVAACQGFTPVLAFRKAP